ncbi:DUF4350 domain-containing protein [Sphingobacterium griseoflavum]|uniref:DUF4350 domain-containing protein n=1 Tax=Sphingobacterium griseoflavum TaxID=1474952 RepID=A0ABQ3HYG8_9SPHI|nr:DUF4350 domain-containing protein [Sphingobacterium griseoflavum]GHE40201.1 hypothetical protein GCM10017764_24240 [Sphingobacterium griseoflavum]
MKNTGKLGIILLVFTLVAIVFIDLTKDSQTDWSRSYDQRDKIPFGLYFTRTELAQILSDSTTVTDFNSTNYDDLKQFLPGKEDACLLFIVNQFYAGNESIDELLSYVERGGEIFISSNSLPGILLDSLGLSQTYYYPQDFGEVIDVGDRPFALSNGRQAYYNELEYPGLFYGIDTIGVHTAGYFEAGKRKLPNFVEVKRNKGRFLIHLEPLMFSNYYMLQEQNFLYGAAALKMLDRKRVFWYDALFKGSDTARTPLRVLLQHEGLRQAWYLLLFGLLLFLLFRSKREQMAVPVVEAEKNLSKEFARTIATLYYEHGSDSNLLQKKVEYFLYDLRSKFFIDTLHLEDVGFAETLSKKTGVPRVDCERIVNLVNRYRKITYSTDSELMDVHRQIEDFKSKANIL